MNRNRVFNSFDAGDQTQALRYAKQALYYWVTPLAPNGHVEHTHFAEARSLIKKGNEC